MPFLIIIPLVLASVLSGVAFYVYPSVFHNKKRRGSADPYAGLENKYLEGMREVAKRGIDDLSAYPCEEITVKGAGHGASFAKGGEEYVRAVLSFTDKYTEENEKGA